MSNPYQAPKETPKVDTATPVAQTAPKKKGWLKWYRAIAWTYPLALIVSLLAAWLTAWAMLGHLPRPSLDDPKYIGWQVDISYTIAGILLIGCPAAALVGLMIECIAEHGSWFVRVASCLMFVGLWTATIYLLRWDPFRIVEWFFD